MVGNRKHAQQCPEIVAEYVRGHGAHIGDRVLGGLANIRHVHAKVADMAEISDRGWTRARETSSSSSTRNKALPSARERETPARLPAQECPSPPAPATRASARAPHSEHRLAPRPRGTRVPKRRARTRVPCFGRGRHRGVRGRSSETARRTDRCPYSPARTSGLRTPWSVQCR